MNLDVFSDAICPWCWIGKRKLEQALAMDGCEGVTVTWRAYQLYPEIPAEGMPREDFMRARFGTSGGGDRSEIWRNLQAEGEKVGLELNFGAAARMPNTLHAHRLERWAHVQGGASAEDAVVENLFRAHFVHGHDLGDRDVLAEIATEAGLDGAAAREWLQGSEGAREVMFEVQWSREHGITGVPCFVLPNGYGIPGAQDPETMARFIRKGKEKLATATDA